MIWLCFSEKVLVGAKRYVKSDMSCKKMLFFLASCVVLSSEASCKAFKHFWYAGTARRNGAVQNT